MNASDRLRRRFLSWPNLIGFLVGLVLLGFLLSQLDLEATVRLLAQTDGTWFLVGCLLYLANNLARSYRFVRLTRAPLHRIPTMLGVVLAMSLANQVLPARLGELSYVYLAHKSQSLPVGQGLVSLLIARLFDLVAIGLLFVLGAGPLLGQLPTPALTYFWIALVSMALVVGVIGALVVWRRALCRLALRLLAARPLSRVPGQARIARLVGDVEVGLDALGGPRQVVDLLSSSLAVWLSNFGMLYALLLSLGVVVSPAQTLIGATAATLTTVLPINSLGNFGTLEAGWTAGFVLVGMDVDLALATGFAVHLQALVYALVFGLAAWAWVLLRGSRSGAE